MRWSIPYPIVNTAKAHKFGGSLIPYFSALRSAPVGAVGQEAQLH